MFDELPVWAKLPRHPHRVDARAHVCVAPTRTRPQPFRNVRRRMLATIPGDLP